MIPIRLEIKNFMSYGDQVMPLDFQGMHLACLSGDNGHGKSAILDAITWALWGEARASGDELLRLGTEEMRVTFDFEVGGDTYRVTRGRSKRNSGNVWEIYVQEPGGDFRPITGQGIRDTEKVIERVLRMSYKTFINSAYIQQGKADEFTKQTVGDRKRILADILDLSRYDILEQRAKEKRGEADQLAHELEREIALSESELSGEAGYREQLEISLTERTELEKQIAEVDERLRGLRTRELELQSTAARVRELEQRASSWRVEVERLLSQKAEQETDIAKFQEILNDRESITNGIKQLHATRELIAKLDRGLDELRTLEHQRTRLEQAISGEQHKLDLQKQSLAKELAELQSKVEAAPRIEKDAADLGRQIEELDALDLRRSDLQKEIDELSDTFGRLKAQRDQLKDIACPELVKKLAMISEPGAKCPLCQTELGHEKHQSVVDNYNAQISEIDQSIATVSRQGADLKARKDAAQKELAAIEERQKAGREVRSHLAQAEQMLLAIGEYQKQLPKVRTRLEEVAAKLTAGDFAAESRAEQKSVEDRISTLAYDNDAHRRSKAELVGLEKYESLHVKLRHAEESLPSQERNLSNTVELIAVREQSIVECRHTIEGMSKSLEELQSVASEVNAVSGMLAGLRESDRQITGRIATLEQSLKRCELLREDVAEKRKMLDKAKKDKSAYTDLVAAFGKKGVQALIIENAIPEIQDEANRLLARMTDNAMQVAIDTVRDKKTGGTAETLDIKISDDMGTRSYELYSGGEAFRVNFALRIALSKLLARRAGARLQTLVIDEGFGTQDAKGREKLVEAIDSIKDDFEKILVITHIDELKDAFPTRIEITKDEMGSHIAVD